MMSNVYEEFRRLRLLRLLYRVYFVARFLVLFLPFFTLDFVTENLLPSVKSNISPKEDNSDNVNLITI